MIRIQHNRYNNFDIYLVLSKEKNKSTYLHVPTSSKRMYVGAQQTKTILWMALALTNVQILCESF